MTRLKDWCNCNFEPEVEAKMQVGSRCPFCTGIYRGKYTGDINYLGDDGFFYRTWLKDGQVIDTERAMK